MKLVSKQVMPDDHSHPWFLADFTCEGCGFTETRRAIDEEHFVEVVTPAMPCPSCGKSSTDLSTGASVATEHDMKEENE